MLHLCKTSCSCGYIADCFVHFERFWWHFSIHQALSNQKWCLFKLWWWCYVVWCLFILWSCKFDLGLLSVNMFFLSRLSAQICFTIQWGIVTVRFEIEILLEQSLLCMLCQLSAMHYSTIQHSAVDSQVDLIGDRSQYVVLSRGIPFSKGFLQ